MEAEQEHSKEGFNQTAERPSTSSSTLPSNRLGPSRLFTHHKRKSKTSASSKPVKIKIEDDDGSYDTAHNRSGDATKKILPKTASSSVNGNVADNGEVIASNGKVSRQVQTSNSFLTSSIVSVVKNRMMQYQSAMLQEDIFNKLLGNKFKQLQEENEALRALANDLQLKLQKSEELHTKKNASESGPFKEPSESLPTKPAANAPNWAFVEPSVPAARPTAIVSPRGLLPSPRAIASEAVHALTSTYRPIAPLPRYTHEQRFPTYAPPQMQFSPNQQALYYQGRPRAPPGYDVVFPPDTGRPNVVRTNQSPRMASLNTGVPPYGARPGMLSNRQNNHPHNYPPYPVNQNAPLANVAWQGVNHPQQASVSFTPLPRLKASISASSSGIILTWDYEQPENGIKYNVECYHLFAHQAKDSRVNPPTEMSAWKKIGVVNALPLPMACTLTQFATGNIYHFAVLAVDMHSREGPMSNPCTIRLNLNN